MDAERFWSRVDTSGECWVWTGYINQDGYGRLSIDGRLIMAHRVSWELHHGPIPDGMRVLHDCPGGDNPACVNPSHLWIGTQRDNIRDMLLKQRQQRGETNGNARLTESDVRTIRDLVAGGMNQSQVARLYGIAPNHICRIVNRRRWQHII